jgi:hypothetical protein
VNRRHPEKKSLHSISPKDLPRAAAWKFIILVGVVSLFSDLTYEGARSITGPFLGSLKASATIIGIVAGLGEFIGVLSCRKIWSILG